MHTNPFTATGYDLQDLRNQINRKADERELHTIRGQMDNLERTNRELSSEVASLRRRCEVLEESCEEMIRAYFGVGA